MKLRTGDPWIPAPEYGRSLTGLTLNLLVKDIDVSLQFQARVLQTNVVYSDPDIAVIRGCGTEWMFHADHTYDSNPLYGLLSDQRGTGVEIRLHGFDPDQAVLRARQFGYTVLAEAADKPHGLRESYLIDPDGYLWVPDMPCETD